MACVLVFTQRGPQSVLAVQEKDFEKVKDMGIDAYKAELDIKVEILNYLLENYNSGRQKGFFCVAVNLLDLKDVQFVMEQISNEIDLDESPKNKSITAVGFFQSMADKRSISLKLRKK